ncbi:hypothetical protein [Poseidonocella sp. HB161398]|uniref:hypothetical protein n=1 Tax=Poseidonocella sp. HB161398 TaxID=2320855 RepID=UPI0011083422|nr:hypothetical protein [Poseidonocella sp. HB161398]
MRHCLAPLALAGLCAAAAPLWAQEPPYAGQWSLDEGDCSDTLSVSEEAIENNLDLQCEISEVVEGDGIYTALSDCSGTPVTFSFSVDGDGSELTFLGGIDFGTGFPSVWHRCPAG